MASLASSAVTIDNSFTAGGINGKRQVVLQCTLVLSGQGGNTNKILASAFDLTKIEECSNAIKDDNLLVYVATPAYDGSYLTLVDCTQATDASRIPADITATVRITVRGYR